MRTAVTNGHAESDLAARRLAARLGQTALLTRVPEPDLVRLAGRATEIGYREGDVVVAEGEGGAGFYVILAGCASVSLDGDLVRALEAGDWFGELSLLGRCPRSATIVAATDLRCAVFPPWEFRAFVAEHPSVASSLRRRMVRYLAPRPG